MQQFFTQYYINVSGKLDIPNNIIISHVFDDRDWYTNAMHQITKRKVHLIVKPRGRHAKWLDMALQNVNQLLLQHVNQQLSLTKQLDQCAKMLKIPRDIQRIECFDNSHTQGEQMVGVCVVCGPSGMAKSLYRRYNIKDIQPGDDYAAMRQVLTRRYKRIKKADGVLPDLIIVDGGKGQLNVAKQVCEDLQITGIALMGIAKGRARKLGDETIWLAGKSEPIFLSNDKPLFHLLQHIRDESHRFAIIGHRKQRSRVSGHIRLQDISGIGPVLRKRLLTHFTSVKAISEASMAELQQVEGISQKKAELLFSLFHAES